MKKHQAHSTLSGWLNENIADNGIGYFPRKGAIIAGLCLVAFYAVTILRIENSTKAPTTAQNTTQPLPKPSLK